MSILYANLFTYLICLMIRSWKSDNIDILLRTSWYRIIFLSWDNEIWEGSFCINKMFIRPEARLNMVRFQKWSVSRDQLTELYHLRVEPV